MDRNEFMELVYETFADEPDNVLANGIIEAADAYVEHEKAQLFKESTTSDLISRTETVERLRGVLDVTVPITDYDGGYVDGVEVGISTVSTMPTIQPQSTAGQLKDGARSTAQSTDLIDRQAAIDRFNVIRPVDPKKDEYTKGIDVGIAMCIVAVKDQPTIQPEPQWISVSERLPEDMQYVLLTVRRLNNAYNSAPFISVGYIGWNQHHWWCAHDGDCEISNVEVLAWTPLPKIYKPNKK